MQLGMVGLGRMGSGMTKRLEPSRPRAEDVRPERQSTAKTLRALAKQLELPRHVWLMVPSGKVTEDTFKQLARHPRARRHDRRRRHRTSATRSAATPRRASARSVRRRRRLGRDLGARGRLLPDGGRRQGARRRLAPVFEASRGERLGARRHSGAGHFTKMVHNGIEYGLMQAYAEGFELMHQSEFELDLSEIADLALRLGRPLAAAGAPARGARAARRRARRHRPLRRGLRRGTLDDQRGDRQRDAAAGDHVGALRALRLPARDRLLRQGAGRAAQPVRRHAVGRSRRRRSARPG